MGNCKHQIEGTVIVTSITSPVIGCRMCKDEEDKNNLRKVLKRLEWSHGDYECPICFQRPNEGHLSSCDLGLVVKLVG